MRHPHSISRIGLIAATIAGGLCLAGCVGGCGNLAYWLTLMSWRTLRRPATLFAVIAAVSVLLIVSSDRGKR